MNSKVLSVLKKSANITILICAIVVIPYAIAELMMWLSLIAPVATSILTIVGLIFIFVFVIVWSHEWFTKW